MNFRSLRRGEAVPAFGLHSLWGRYSEAFELNECSNSLYQDRGRVGLRNDEA